MVIDTERPTLNAEDLPEVQAMNAMADSEGASAVSSNPAAPTLDQIQETPTMAQALETGNRHFQGGAGDASGMKDISRLRGRAIGVTAWRRLDGAEVVLPLKWDTLGRAHNSAMHYFSKAIQPSSAIPIEAQHLVGQSIFMPRPPENPPLRVPVEVDEEGEVKWNCLWCKKVLATEADRENHMRGYHGDRYRLYRDAITREEEREQANATLELNRRMGDLMEQLIADRSEGASVGRVVEMLEQTLQGNTAALKQANEVAEGRWLSLRAAGIALDVTSTTIRKRIQDGKMEGRQSQSGGPWQVFLTKEEIAERDITNLEQEAKSQGSKRKQTSPVMKEH